jgi:hypothetical protein
MLQAEEIYRMLQPKPFQPVRVYLKDGQTYDIKFRELVIVGVTFLDIGIPEAGETKPIYDYVVTVPLEEIDRIERLTPSTPSVSG